MRRNWRRTETRTVRPFPRVDDCLAGVCLRIFPDEDFDERTSFDAAEIGTRDIRPEFRLPLDLAALGPLSSLSPADLSLVIRLADVRLRRSEVVLDSTPESLPQTWALPRSVRDRLSWKFGVEATVALVLKSDRSPRPGHPFLRGHWLARRDFSVRSKPEPRAFPIERWTAEDFARHELPRDTVYWIQFVAEDLNRRFEDPGDAFRVCLRADVYQTLDDTQDTGPGRAVMSVLCSEVLAEILWRGLRSLEDHEEIEKGGLLQSVLAKVEKATNATKDTLCKLVAAGELSSLRTFAQAAVGTRRAVVRLAKGS